MTKQAKAIVKKKDYLDGKPCVSVIGKINNPSGQPIIFNITCAVDTACSTGVFIADISMNYLKSKGVKLTMDTVELADGKTRMVYSCLGTIQTIDGQGFILPFAKDIVVSVSSIVTDAVSLLGLDALKYFVTICDGQKRTFNHYRTCRVKPKSLAEISNWNIFLFLLSVESKIEF